MRIKLTARLMLFGTLIAGAQTSLTIEGKTYTNSDDTWNGVNIDRDVKTKLVFKNNSISSINRYGYLLQAGDESKNSTNNNLDGAIITGNKLNWSGTDMKVIPHGIFTGHNSNVVAKYNYLNNVPMGIIRKSGTNMSNTGGGVAYNIVKNGAVGIVVKGMSNVNIFNNTLYTDRTTSQTWRPLVHIYTNTDGGGYSVAHGTKIYNNIFYTKYQTYAISVDDKESLNGLECDYNVYWSESGSPTFNIAGSVKTFAQWQAMGYDKHSVVVNPQFKDLTSFVPSKRLDYGKDLGSEWQYGLATDAKWGTTDPATAAQNGTWQAGAVVYAATATQPVAPAPVYSGSVISGNSPSVIEMTYSLTLANIVPPASSFIVKVNSAQRSINPVVVSGTKVMLTMASPAQNGDVVTVTYTKSAVNPLQTAEGGQAESFSDKVVVNNVPKSDVTPPDTTQTPKTPETPGPSDASIITISPNPAHQYLKIENLEPSESRIVRIFSFTGKLAREVSLGTGSSVTIPIDFASGMYFVQVEIGTVIKHIQKVMVLK
jgi:hypothetical protein